MGYILEFCSKQEMWSQFFNANIGAVHKKGNVRFVKLSTYKFN